jgi:hypothetical protein
MFSFFTGGEWLDLHTERHGWLVSWLGGLEIVCSNWDIYDHEQNEQTKMQKRRGVLLHYTTLATKLSSLLSLLRLLPRYLNY